MKIKRIAHVAVAVPSIDEALGKFQQVLGLEVATQNALALTQDSKKRDEVKSALSEAWAIARTSSAQQALPQEWGGDVLLRSRF